jgi:hypothetical protein
MDEQRMNNAASEVNHLLTVRFQHIHSLGKSDIQAAEWAP